ncbi:MAG: DNA-directed RNA polymerase [Candidatus Bathyarchaeota archaeon]
MHDAVCAECGQKCQVPFKPDQSRPVYCRDCYSKRRNTRRRY